MIPGGARSKASRKSASETYSRITLISACRAYVMAYAMNRTGSARARSGGSNQMILGAIPNICAVAGIGFIARSRGPDRFDGRTYRYRAGGPDRLREPQWG